MPWKPTRDFSKTRRKIAMIAAVIVSSTIVAGCQSNFSPGPEPRQMHAIETKLVEAQGPGSMDLEEMPEQLEAVMKEAVDFEINAVIAHGLVGPGGSSPRERIFVTKEWFGKPVLRVVSLPASLEAMSEPLEEAIRSLEDVLDLRVNAIIALGPNGQERTFLTRERFNPDDPGRVLMQVFPIVSPKQIYEPIGTRSGVVYLSWEASPGHLCQKFPGIPECVPVPH